MGAVRNLNVHGKPRNGVSILKSDDDFSYLPLIIDHYSPFPIEYISMELMNQHGIATPRGFVANTPEEAEHIFTTMMNKRTLLC